MICWPLGCHIFQLIVVFNFVFWKCALYFNQVSTYDLHFACRL